MMHDKKALARLDKSISEDPVYFKPYTLQAMIYKRKRQVG